MHTHIISLIWCNHASVICVSTKLTDILQTIRILIWHTILYMHVYVLTAVFEYVRTAVLVYSNRNFLFIECTKLSQTECTRQEYRTVQDAHPSIYKKVSIYATYMYLQIVNLNKINNTINQ